MTPLTHSHRTAECKICGNLVPASNLPEHLLADARILRLIKATHLDWSQQECEDYLRALSGTSRQVERT